MSPEGMNRREFLKTAAAAGAAAAMGSEAMASNEDGLEKTREAAAILHKWVQENIVAQLADTDVLDEKLEAIVAGLEQSSHWARSDLDRALETVDFYVRTEDLIPKTEALKNDSKETRDEIIASWENLKKSIEEQLQ